MVPIVQEAGWATGPVWTGGKTGSTGIRSPDRPARSPVAIPTDLPGPQFLFSRVWKSYKSLPQFRTTEFFCTHNSMPYQFTFYSFTLCTVLPPRTGPYLNLLTFRRLTSTIVTYRTANLQNCILYIYSTNIGTGYFKHGIYSPFFLLYNAVCFIILTCLVPELFTFYIQSVLKLKKNNSFAKRLISSFHSTQWATLLSLLRSVGLWNVMSGTYHTAK
jgi:hypothetical protein